MTLTGENSMQWMEPFYTGDLSEEEIEGMKAEANEGDNKLYGNCYAVTLPFNPKNLFEILSFHQLTIPYYRELNLKVVGLARDKESATNIVCSIIEDMIKSGNEYNVNEFFN